METNDETIKALIKERNKIKNWEKELKDRKKEIDQTLLTYCESNNTNRLEVNNLTATVVMGKSGGRWDKNKLFQILTPMQLEEVYQEGSKYSSVRVTERVEKKE